MRRLTAISAVMLFALAPERAGAIDPPKKPEPAATFALPPAAEPALTAEMLKTSIKQLHDDFSGTTEALEKMVKDVEKLQAALDQQAKLPTTANIIGTLTGLKNELGRFPERFEEIKSELQQLEEKRVAAEAGRLAKAAPEFEQMRAQLTALQAELDKLRKDIAARPNPVSPSGPPSGATPGLVLGGLAGGLVVLASLILFTSAAQRRELRAVRPAAGHPVGIPMISAAPDAKALQHESQAAFARWSEESSARTEKIEAALASLAGEIRALATRPAPTVSPIMTPPPEPSPSAPASPASAMPWPAPFLESGSRLAAWRQRLEAHINSAEHPAKPVYSALLSLQAAAQRATPLVPELAAGISTVSQALHDYWLSLPGLSEDESLQANADWISGVKALTVTAAPKLDIRAITPGTRFDPESMQTVQEGSGNHLSVAQVFSWVVLDRSGERARILHRARIATT